MFMHIIFTQNPQIYHLYIHEHMNYSSQQSTVAVNYYHIWKDSNIYPINIKKKQPQYFWENTILALILGLLLNLCSMQLLISMCSVLIQKRKSIPVLCSHKHHTSNVIKCRVYSWNPFLSLSISSFYKHTPINLLRKFCFTSSCFCLYKCFYSYSLTFYFYSFSFSLTLLCLYLFFSSMPNLLLPNWWLFLHFHKFLVSSSLAFMLCLL